MRRDEDKVGEGGGGQVGTEIHPNRFCVMVQQVDVPYYFNYSSLGPSYAGSC